MITSNEQAPLGAKDGENTDCKLPHKQSDLAAIVHDLVEVGAEFTTVAIYGCYRCGDVEHSVHVAHATGTSVANVDDLVSLIKALRHTANSLQKVLGRPV
jgi:hypothetical protein